MKAQEMNIAMVEVLRQWDPFNQGEDFYGPEIADCMMAIRDIENSKDLARKIKEIYEFSFEESLASDECLKIAEKLLTIKNSASCSF